MLPQRCLCTAHQDNPSHRSPSSVSLRTTVCGQSHTDVLTSGTQLSPTIAGSSGSSRSVSPADCTLLIANSFRWLGVCLRGVTTVCHRCPCLFRRIPLCPNHTQPGPPTSPASQDCPNHVPQHRSHPAKCACHAPAGQAASCSWRRAELQKSIPPDDRSPPSGRDLLTPVRHPCARHLGLHRRRTHGRCPFHERLDPLFVQSLVACPGPSMRTPVC